LQSTDANGKVYDIRLTFTVEMGPDSPDAPLQLYNMIFRKVCVCVHECVRLRAYASRFAEFTRVYFYMPFTRLLLKGSDSADPEVPANRSPLL
jgi:hypothetical protein